MILTHGIPEGCAQTDEKAEASHLAGLASLQRQTADLDYAAHLARCAEESLICPCCLLPINGEALTDPDFERVCERCAATLTGAEQGFEELAA
jgi:hypothetical protein